MSEERECDREQFESSDHAASARVQSAAPAPRGRGSDGLAAWRREVMIFATSISEFGHFEI